MPFLDKMLTKNIKAFYLDLKEDFLIIPTFSSLA
jgi:hypothetical protein